MPGVSRAAFSRGWDMASSAWAPLAIRWSWALSRWRAASREITEPMKGAGWASKAPTWMVLATLTRRASRASPQAPCGTSRRRAQVQRWPAEMKADWMMV
ncbi:hypothetical protein D3C84_868370 [compost metagenome]